MAPSDSQPSDSEANDASEQSSVPVESETGDQGVSKVDSNDSDSLREDVEGLLDSIDAGDEIESDPESNPTPNASDELLMKAASVLNGEPLEIPQGDETADAVGEMPADDGEDLMDMPDPQSLFSESESEEPSPQPEGANGDQDPSGQSEELVEMPKPEDLIREAGGDVPEASSDGSKPTAPPPPPPAPVALEEEEIDLGQSSESLLEAPENAIEDSEPPSSPESDGLEVVESTETEASQPQEVEPPEPTASEDEGESEGDGEPDSEDDGELFLDDDSNEEEFAGIVSGDSEDFGDLNAQGASFGAGDPLEQDSGQANSRGSKWSRLASLPVAAALALLATSIFGASYKDELIDWIVHQNFEQTRIRQSVTKIAESVFSDFEASKFVEIAWIENEIHRVSESEYTLAGKIGVELSEDLYVPIDDSYAYAILPFSSQDLLDAYGSIDSTVRGPMTDLPSPSWSQLVKKSGSKGGAYEIRFDCSLERSGEGQDWTLSSLTIDPEGDGLAWSSGRLKTAFGSGAVDVASDEFPFYLRAFEKAGLRFLKDLKGLEADRIARLEAEANRVRRARQDLAMSLSQGALFSGMAIVGEDGSETREISLVITETRNDGELIKGLMKVGAGEYPAKHFTGLLTFLDDSENPKARVDLTTIAFADQTAEEALPLFFNPGTVSRMELHTDGFRMDGDARDISLRLTRGM